MRFRTRLIAIIAGMVSLVVILLLAGWLASGRLLNATDIAYQHGLELTQAVDVAREAQVAFQRQVQEWKNVLIRGGDPELRSRHWQGFEAQEATMDKQLQQLGPKLTDLGMEALTETVQHIIDNHKTLGQRYRSALNSQSTLDAKAQMAIDTQVRGMDRPTSAGIDTLVNDLQKRVTQRFNDEASAVRNKVTNQFFTGALVTVLFTALLVLMGVLLSRSVLKTLGADPEDAMSATSRIARGDLTERLDVKVPGSLISALDMMQSRFRNIVLAIHSVAEDISERAKTLPATEAAEQGTLLNDIERLRRAIERIQIDRGDRTPLP